MSYPVTAPVNVAIDANGLRLPSGDSITPRYDPTCDTCTAGCDHVTGGEIVSTGDYKDRGSQDLKLLAEYMIEWEKRRHYLYWLLMGDAAKTYGDHKQFEISSVTSSGITLLDGDDISYNSLFDDGWPVIRVGRSIIVYGGCEYRVVRVVFAAATSAYVYVNKPIVVTTDTAVDYYEDNFDDPHATNPQESFKKWVVRRDTDWVSPAVLTLRDGAFESRIAYPIKWRTAKSGTFRVTASDGLGGSSTLAHYKCLDNAANSTVTDISSNGNDGSVILQYAHYPGYLFTSLMYDASGKIGSCYSNSYSNLYPNAYGVRVPETPMGAFSVAMWIKRNSNPATNQHLFGFRADQTSNQYPYCYFTTYSGNFRVVLRMASTNHVSWNLPFGNTDYAWHHYVITCPGAAQGDIANAKLFIDGVDTASLTPVTVTAQGTRTQFAFAASSHDSGTTGCLFHCSFDDLRLHDSALAQSDVDDIYNSGTGTEEEFVEADAEDITTYALENFPGPSARLVIERSISGWLCQLDLSARAETYVKVEYCEECSDQDNPDAGAFKPTEMKCDNCRRDWSNSYHFTGAVGTFNTIPEHWYCRQLRSADKVADFDNKCYECNCSHFVLNTPWFPTAAEMAGIIYGRNIYYEVTSPPSTITCRRAHNPGLMFLAGMPCPTHQDIAASEYEIWPTGHNYDGDVGCFGRLIAEPDPGVDDGDVSIVEYGLLSETDGVLVDTYDKFYAPIADGNTDALRRSGVGDNWSLVHQHLAFARTHGGARMNTQGDPQPTEHRVQSCYKPTIIKITHDRTNFGDYQWVDDEIHIDPVVTHNGNVLSFGGDLVVYAAWQVLDKSLKLSFSPGVYTVDYPSGGYTEQHSWLGCGCTVQPGPEKQVTNPGAGRAWMDFDSGLHIGCTIKLIGAFPYTGVTFTCVAAGAFTGAEYSGSLETSEGLIPSTRQPYGTGVPDWFSVDAQRLAMDTACFSIDGPHQAEAATWLIANGVPIGLKISVYRGSVVPPKYTWDGDTLLTYRIVHRWLTAGTQIGTETLVEGTDFDIDRPEGTFYNIGYTAGDYDHCFDLQDSAGGLPVLLSRLVTRPAQLITNITTAMENLEWSEYGGFGDNVYLTFISSRATTDSRGAMQLSGSWEFAAGVYDDEDMRATDGGDLVWVDGEPTDPPRLNIEAGMFSEVGASIDCHLPSIKLDADASTRGAFARWRGDLVKAAKVDFKLTNATYTLVTRVLENYNTVTETYDILPDVDVRLMALWVERGDPFQYYGGGPADFAELDVQLAGFSAVNTILEADSDKWNTIDITELVKRACDNILVGSHELWITMGGIGPAGTKFPDLEDMLYMSLNEIFYMSVGSNKHEITGADSVYGLKEQLTIAGRVEFDSLAFRRLKIQVDHDVLDTLTLPCVDGASIS